MRIPDRRAIASAVLVLLVCLLVLAPGAPAGAAPDSDSAAAASIVARANAARAADGLAPLTRNPSLDAVALAWAHRMADAAQMSHNPDVADQIPGGWRRVGENVAQGYRTGASMHAGWMASSGHRENILDDYTDIGVAFLTAGGTTWGVQVFASYSDTAARPAPVTPTKTRPTKTRPTKTRAPKSTPTVTPTPQKPTPASASSATPVASAPHEPEASTDGESAAASGAFAGAGRTAVAGAVAGVAAVGAGLLVRRRRRRTAAAGRHRA